MTQRKRDPLIDKLAFLFWWVYDRWSEWRFFRWLGNGDVEKGRVLLRAAIWNLGPCDARGCWYPAVRVVVGEAGDFYFCTSHRKGET